MSSRYLWLQASVYASADDLCAGFQVIAITFSGILLFLFQTGLLSIFSKVSPIFDIDAGF